MAKKLVILGAILAVAFPIAVHIINVNGENSSLLAVIFPIFGLLAFTLLWLHAVSGFFTDKWLYENFDFDAFVHWTATAILVSMLLHPLLLLILLKFNFNMLFGSFNLPIYLGLAGLILLLTYDIGKAFRKKYDFFAKYWTEILIISNLGFVLIFFHALQIGSDLQTGFMRSLWMFYGVTGILALVYTYGVKRFLN